MFDPKKRLSAAEALKHPYFKELHDAEDEPEGQEMDYFDFEFENYNLDKEILRDLILDEVLLYHNEKAKKHYQQLKDKFPKGLLEFLYRRDESSVSSGSTLSD